MSLLPALLLPSLKYPGLEKKRRQEILQLQTTVLIKVVQEHFGETDVINSVTFAGAPKLFEISEGANILTF